MGWVNTNIDGDQYHQGHQSYEYQLTVDSYWFLSQVNGEEKSGDLKPL